MPEGLLDRCRTVTSDIGVTLHIVVDLDARAKIGELVAEGDRIQFADVRFRRELASWVHSRRLGSRDGMSGEGFGMPDILSPVGALVIRSFDLGKNVAAGDRDKIVSGSPVLAVFATERDDQSSWLVTGRALARALLMLTADGVASSYLNQPVEVESLRPRLRDAIGAKGSPQLLIRMGFGPNASCSVRRPLSEVILS